MRFFLGLVGWNIVTQCLLIAAFFFYKNHFIASHTLWLHFPAYTIFLVAGVTSMFWILWTYFWQLFSLRGVGDKSGRAAKIGRTKQ